MGRISFAWILLVIYSVLTPVVAQEAISVRVGIPRQAGLTNANIALKEGPFAMHGLTASLIEFRSGNEAIAALQGGSVDIILSSPPFAMTANEADFDLVLLAQNETAHIRGPDTGSIQVDGGSLIKSPAELLGKTVGVNTTRAHMTIALKKIFRDQVIDPNKVSYIEMPFFAQHDALKNKRVDAVISVDPLTTQMVLSGAGRIIGWLYSESIPEQPIGAWYAKAPYLAKNSLVGDRFIQAIRASIDWMNADEARARREIAIYTGLEPLLIAQMPLNKLDYRIHPDKWQALIDMFVLAGELRQSHKFEEYVTDYIKADIIK